MNFQIFPFQAPPVSSSRWAWVSAAPCRSGGWSALEQGGPGCQQPPCSSEGWSALEQGSLGVSSPPPPQQWGMVFSGEGEPGCQQPPAAVGDGLLWSRWACSLTTYGVTESSLLWNLGTDTLHCSHAQHGDVHLACTWGRPRRVGGFTTSCNQQMNDPAFLFPPSNQWGLLSSAPV